MATAVSIRPDQRSPRQRLTPAEQAELLARAERVMAALDALTPGGAGHGAIRFDRGLDGKIRFSSAVGEGRA